MKFMYPLGLLGLLGIPVLIIIYIIKNKYTEQTVSSTYLWELSERFLKRRKKVNPIAGLLSLILQIVMVAAVSLAVAHPVVVLPNQAKELCFVIDGSGSMNMETDGKTRFDRAKEYAAEQIERSVQGSVYSLIRISEGTEIVYERIDDKEEALSLLGSVEPGFVDADTSDAIAMLQNYFNFNPGVKTVFLTDRKYETTENIQVVDFSSGEKNLSVMPLSATLRGDVLTVGGSVVYYPAQKTENVSENVTLELYLNDMLTAAQTVDVSVSSSEPALFSFVQEGVAIYERVRVAIKDADDQLALDNESVLFNVDNENAYTVLVVSDAPFLLSTAIRSVGGAQVTVISPDEYDGQRGFGLYVFDGFAPDTVPTDGAIWFINVKNSIPGTGFSFQNEEELPEGEKLTLAPASSALAQRLTKDMEGGDVYISKYLRYGRSKQFVTLMSYKNSPVVFTGVTDAENRQVVFAFDIHDTDFPLQTDFTVLVRNLLNYSFPSVVEEVSFFSGDVLEVNLSGNMGAVRVEAPSGEHVYLSTQQTIAEYIFTEVGVHTVTVTYEESGAQRNYYVYAGVAESERDPYTVAPYLGLQGQATDGGLEGRFDTLTIVFVVLILFFFADWGVYCYEKYQLR